MKKLILMALCLNALFLAGRIWQEFGGSVHAGAPTTQNGDVNGDGGRDISDAIYLLFWLFKDGPEPVALADSPELVMRVEALEDSLAELEQKVPTAGEIAGEIAAHHADVLLGALDPDAQPLQELALLLGDAGLVRDFPAAALQEIPPGNGLPDASGEFVFSLKGVSLGRVVGFIGEERISRLSEFHVALKVETPLDSEDLLGQPAVLHYRGGKGTTFFSGRIARCGLASRDASGRTYSLTLLPSQAQLTLQSGFRIFQDMNATQIIEEFLDDYSLNVQGSLTEHEYVVQYGETDFNFVSRLLEQEGIFYYFAAGEGQQVMVLGDDTGAYGDVPGGGFAHYGHNSPPGAAGEEYIRTLRREVRQVPGRYTLRDYNFEIPTADLTVSATGGSFPFEIYDYPGLYGDTGNGQRLAQIRLEEVQRNRSVLSGTSTCRDFTPGHRFTIQDHTRGDPAESHVLTAVKHVGIVSQRGGKTTVKYGNTFSCIPDSVTFRPPRITPKPVVQGPQTARVVGSPGEEIYTDQYGRVKVQFHWDRYGNYDERSSCWIRVSQVHAGNRWGGIDIPRIGEEVIVDFIEGDPDRPLITGRVYNAELLPPYNLPESKSLSGIKTRSTPDGGLESNEIQFDDKKGQELIFIHGGKDLNIETGNDFNIQTENDFQIAAVNKFRIESGNTLEVLTPGGTILSSRNASGQVQAGERYRDNAIVAWAAVRTRNPAYFGVRQITNPRLGQYRIQLTASATNASALIPVATAILPEVPGKDPLVHIASIRQVSEDTFDVFLNDPNGPVKGEFNFMVTAR